jgi:DNA polymerase-3 subunit gamma/tau
MSDYIVTARKWRPVRFEDVVGQSHVTQTLRNAIRGGRIAHAYLFSGPRGVGKTTTARLLAKAVNCLHPEDANPDNVCEICREITDGTSFDVLEIDGASNRGIDEIRNLRESVRYAPAKGTYRVYIIDEVHMLTKESFNALLKTLEEPPSHVLFIFATTEIHKVPATILSRCQRFDFRRITLDEIIANLRAIAGEEELIIDEESLMIIARKGDGSLRDAQSIFDQATSLCGRTIAHAALVQALNMVDQEVFFRVTDLIRNRDERGALALVEELMSQGHDMKEFLGGLLEHFRNIMIVKATGSSALLEVSDVYRKRYETEAESFSIADTIRYQRHVNGTEFALKNTIQPRFRLEADMVQLVTLPAAEEITKLIEGIDELKRKVENGRSVGASPPAEPGSKNRAGGVATSPFPGRGFGGTTAKGGTAAVESDAPRSPGGRSLGEGEIRSRWEEILAEVGRQRISLKSALEAGTLLNVAGNVVRVAFADEFQASHIQRNREFLSALMEKVLNAPVRVEAVVNPQASAMREDGNVPPRAEAESGNEDDPIITVLRKELGAEPLE